MRVWVERGEGFRAVGGAACVVLISNSIHYDRLTLTLKFCPGQIKDRNW